jgi:hypothetical protein
MIPAYDPNHATEILALLTEVFKNATNLRMFLSQIAIETQALEDALLNPQTGYAFLIQLVNAVGDALDKYGDILELPRNGRTDDDYRAALYLQIRVNRSMGLAEDVIQVTALITSGALYMEGYPAGFNVQVSDLTPSQVLALLLYLPQTRSGGTYGTLTYSDWADGNDFEWADVNNLSTTGQGTWGDTVAGVVGGLLLSSQAT